MKIGGPPDTTGVSPPKKPSIHLVAQDGSLIDDPTLGIATRQDGVNLSNKVVDTPSLALELQQVFEKGSNYPRFKEIEKLLPSHSPLVPRDLSLLQGIKFGVKEVDIVRHVNQLSQSQRDSGVARLLNGDPSYASLTEPKLLISLPKEFESNPIKALAALDYVAAAVNYLTRDWELKSSETGKSRPVAIEVVTDDSKNQILDLNDSRTKDYLGGWTFMLARPNAENSFKAVLRTEVTTPEDLARISSISGTEADNLKRVSEATVMLEGEHPSKYLGNYGLTFGTFMDSSGTFHLAPVPVEDMSIPKALIKNGYIGEGSTAQAYVDLHRQYGEVKFNQLLWKRPVAANNGTILFTNPLSPVLPALFKTVDARFDPNTSRINVYGLGYGNYPKLAKVLQLAGFALWARGVGMLRQVDDPEGGPTPKDTHIFLRELKKQFNIS